MENLVKLSQDKATLKDLKDFMYKKMYAKIVDKVIKKEDVSGYADAKQIIKDALEEIDSLFKDGKKSNKINQSE
jgi:hypothetical protein